VLLYRSHDFRVRHVVEKSLDIEINYPRMSPTPLLAHFHRVQRRFTRTVAIGIVVEDWLHLRFQDHGHRRLRYPVGDDGYT